MAKLQKREGLIDLRIACELSQEELAAVLTDRYDFPVSRATISLWERGDMAKQSNGRRSLRRYCETLGRLYKEQTGLMPPQPHELAPDLAEHRRRK